MSPLSTNRYKNHRFPAEMISHGVWLYFRFCLSYCDVEELLFARGVIVTYEAIRQWCRTFGQEYANQLRRRRPRPGDTWHLDAVFRTINGTRHSLWRAVDQDGHVLDILVQNRRDTKAANVRFASSTKVLARTAPERFASVRSTPVRFAPVRSAPGELCLGKVRLSEVHVIEIRLGEVRLGKVNQYLSVFGSPLIPSLLPLP